jgi:ribonuclease HI
MKDLVQSLDELSTISISYTHVYRKENTVADGLANEAMDTKLSWVR